MKSKEELGRFLGWPRQFGQPIQMIQNDASAALLPVQRFGPPQGTPARCSLLARCRFERLLPSSKSVVSKKERLSQCSCQERRDRITLRVLPVSRGPSSFTDEEEPTHPNHVARKQHAPRKRKTMTHSDATSKVAFLRVSFPPLFSEVRS